MSRTEIASHHRVHHGKNPEYINKNHGGTFVFWDKLFGTFQPERDDIKIKYGTTNNVNPENPFWANMLPIFDYFNINLREKKEGEFSKIRIHDMYIVIGSLLLFLLLLMYINNEQTWNFWQLASLFSIVFFGTIALGSVARNQKVGLITWIFIAIPLSIGFVVFFGIQDILLLGIVIGVVSHGIYGFWKLVNVPKLQHT
ncbi:MAG: sterol desaturase family protein [Saprospiraceae bacterium]